ATVYSTGAPVTSPAPPVSASELDSSDGWGTIDDEDYFSLTLDQSCWPAETDRTTPAQPVSFGQIAIATYHTDGADGFSYLLSPYCYSIDSVAPSMPLFCKMMYYLDSTRTSAGSLFNAMLTYSLSKTVVSPYSGAGTNDPDKGQRQNWLFNAMSIVG
ncbi:hypothetical protein MMC27_000572, partial [Xylographa pallens]|nr:hypothetical protein [Xylographa pallens]